MIYNLGTCVVNTYLIRHEDGYILVDTGYDGGIKHFAKELKRLSIKPEEIKYVFLTHAHDDHAGFLNDILAMSQAKVILHKDAISGLRRGQNSFEGGCSGRLAYVFCLILALCGKGEHRYPVLKEKYMDRLITIDSKEFKELSFPYKVIETPGHTKDHISLMVGDIIFCGDAAMNNFPSINRNIIWIENLSDYKASWEKLIEAQAKYIYPAHGKPFLSSDLRKYQSRLEKLKIYHMKNK